MKKQDNSKKMLFEAMHKVAGMPLREENEYNPFDDNEPIDMESAKEGQEIQNKLNDVDVSSSALLGVIDKLTDLSPEEKNELSGLLNRVLKITGDQIPKFYNDTDAIRENDNGLNEWTIIDDYNLPSYKSYGNDSEFKEIVESMSLIEGPVDEFIALAGYLDYAKANGISDTSKHAEIVLDVLNYFRKRGGEIPNDPNASGSREY